MMALERIARTFDKANWKQLWRLMRKHGYAKQHDYGYAEKLAIQETILKEQKDGMVRISDRFMDCDHAISTCTRLVPATVVHVMRYLNNIYDNAEGPGNAWIHSPDDIPERDARDLALEAFEDGHSHSVSMVRHDEDGSYYMPGDDIIN